MIYSKNLKRISRSSDLNKPESVERYVFGLKVTNKYRNSLFDAYSHYIKTNDIEWQRPVLKTEVYPVKIPTEENIDKIIACATPKYATIFHISKHGLRPDEISKITLRDIDFDRGTLNVRTSKMGLDRTLKLKHQTRDLLRDYIGFQGISDVHQRLFASPRTIRDTWSVY
jgi:integrase